MIAKEQLVAFYNDYVADGSNVSVSAKKHGITPTECFMLVKMGKNHSKK